MLGVANLDAKHYDAAAKWYKAALIKKPDDLVSLHGYAYVLLQIGDIKAAEQTINKLEKIDPTSQDLPQFRAKLAELKAKPK
jgi:predicted Zn-dependent protease